MGVMECVNCNFRRNLPLIFSTPSKFQPYQIYTMYISAYIINQLTFMYVPKGNVLMHIKPVTWTENKMKVS